MQQLTVAEAAKLLGVSPRRVQQLVRAGRLPAKQFAGAYVINEKDLALVADRKPGRPTNQLSTRRRRSSTDQNSRSKRGQ
jgi:excisionase family DNA binding protein